MRKKRMSTAWALTAHQATYIDQAVEFAVKLKGYVQKEIAQAAGVNEQQVSRWHQDPRFRGAVAEAMRGIQSLQVETTMNAALQLAARGNLAMFNAVMDRLEKWGRILGFSAATAAQTSAGVLPGQTVEVHIHGIPEPANRATLPPLLELPAKASTASHAPK